MVLTLGRMELDRRRSAASGVEREEVMRRLVTCESRAPQPSRAESSSTSTEERKKENGEVISVTTLTWLYLGRTALAWQADRGIERTISPLAPAGNKPLCPCSRKMVPGSCCLLPVPTECGCRLDEVVIVRWRWRWRKREGEPACLSGWILQFYNHRSKHRGVVYCIFRSLNV
jgi:hypothetical protein